MNKVITIDRYNELKVIEIENKEISIGYENLILAVFDYLGNIYRPEDLNLQGLEIYLYNNTISLDLGMSKFNPSGVRQIIK